MSEFKDYSMMFARISNWPKEKLIAEAERYNKKREELSSKKARYAKNISILSQNAAYFEKKIKEIEGDEIRESFVLKKEHLLLLKSLNVSSEEDYIHTDHKRPLGYSSHIEGLVKALGLELDHNELTDEQEEPLWKLLRELPIALEFIIDLELAKYE